MHDTSTMDKSTNIASLINNVRDGGDYDIAKLFIHLFPDSPTYTDKEISIKLSEDVHNLILEQVKLLSKKMCDISLNTSSEFGEYDSIKDKIAQYEEKLRALRTHKHKQQFIAEIKAIR